MKIDRNSIGTLALVYAVNVIVVVILASLVRLPYVVWPVTALAIWFCVWQTCFFRVPKRQAAGDGRHVSSVADGRVIIIEKAYEKEFLKRDCMQISVYMNFFDVHANFWPVSGEITYYKYHPGLHLYAHKPKASEENEHTCTCIKTEDGKDVFFKQIAGGFARRIVNYAVPGMKVKAGDQCGIIKFGSRIDIFLPLDAEIKVEMHELTRACETILCQL